VTTRTRVVVIGAGQAGLAAGFHLRRAGFRPDTGYVLLDRNPGPGGSWQHMWNGLRLFSPAEHSSLPGRRMPASSDGFPPAAHVQRYLADYEQRYELPVQHGVGVTAVHSPDDPTQPLQVHTTRGTFTADAVISATGTWDRPFWPAYPGMRQFRGHQLHAHDYRTPAEFAGQHVVVVGGGNSAAQILAEVSTVARTTWITPRPPRYLPDDVDGRVLFDVANQRATVLAAGGTDTGGVSSLGDIVMVPTVKDARHRGALEPHPPPERLTPDGIAWPDGTHIKVDVIIWCTGFRPELNHLAPLRLDRTSDHIATHGTQAASDPRVHLLGYGDWTGPASATLIGVGRTARTAVGQIAASNPPQTTSTTATA
jgi:putative flavoprotein involved in K+ transport